jgi:ribonuclease HI
MGSTEKNEVIIYTDGACSGNPGPGGWGALLRYQDKEKELSGGEAHTTNNRMEMMAVIQAVQAIKKPCRLKIHSDSALIINAMTKGWIESWQSKGWKKADKKPVENQDLWMSLLDAIQSHDIEWIKVKGHAGIPDNERVDQLAVQAVKKFM